MLAKLINKKISISIGEPWDFKSEEGNNLLKGKIDLVSDINEIEWIRCEVNPFIVKGQKIASVVAVSRYAKMSFEYLLKGQTITSNILYKPTGEKFTSDQMSEILKKKTGASFLVGSITLTQ